jgi:hypothetical protein
MRFLYHQELVLQLPAESGKCYQTLLELENSILTGLGWLGSAGGHDLGKGEMNIFVRTNEPEFIFEKIKASMGTQDFLPEMKVAYRDVGKDNYTILYPANLAHFAVA